jgi:hypothetical protein
MDADEPVKVTLMLEASWGDVLAVLMVGLLLGLQSQTGPMAAGLTHRFLAQSRRGAFVCSGRRHSVVTPPACSF